eukprot:Lithocolla_globosa_v1_NODE_1071_length_2896_cov_130.926786.p1 type:complete len:334 gc:universal NODE_1071_length_2896_cov_130.926786:946-1947(+)
MNKKTFEQKLQQSKPTIKDVVKEVGKLSLLSDSSSSCSSSDDGSSNVGSSSTPSLSDLDELCPPHLQGIPSNIVNPMTIEEIHKSKILSWGDEDQEFRQKMCDSTHKLTVENLSKMNDDFKKSYNQKFQKPMKRRHRKKSTHGSSTESVISSKTNVTGLKSQSGRGFFKQPKGMHGSRQSDSASSGSSVDSHSSIGSAFTKRTNASVFNPKNMSPQALQAYLQDQKKEDKKKEKIIDKYNKVHDEFHFMLQLLLDNGFIEDDDQLCLKYSQSLETYSGTTYEHYALKTLIFSALLKDTKKKVDLCIRSAEVETEKDRLDEDIEEDQQQGQYVN